MAAAESLPRPELEREESHLGDATDTRRQPLRPESEKRAVGAIAIAGLAAKACEDVSALVWEKAFQVATVALKARTPSALGKYQQQLECLRSPPGPAERGAMRAADDFVRIGTPGATDRLAPI